MPGDMLGGPAVSERNLTMSSSRLSSDKSIGSGLIHIIEEECDRVTLTMEQIVFVAGENGSCGDKGFEGEHYFVSGQSTWLALSSSLSGVLASLWLPIRGSSPATMTQYDPLLDPDVDFPDESTLNVTHLDYPITRELTENNIQGCKEFWAQTKYVDVSPGDGPISYVYQQGASSTTGMDSG